MQAHLIAGIVGAAVADAGAHVQHFSRSGIKDVQVHQRARVIRHDKYTVVVSSLGATGDAEHVKNAKTRAHQDGTALQAAVETPVPAQPAAPLQTTVVTSSQPVGATPPVAGVTTQPTTAPTTTTLATAGSGPKPRALGLLVLLLVLLLGAVALGLYIYLTRAAKPLPSRLNEIPCDTTNMQAWKPAKARNTYDKSVFDAHAGKDSSESEDEHVSNALGSHGGVGRSEEGPEHVAEGDRPLAT